MLREVLHIPSKKLIGKKMTMSFAENKTGELWRSFMPYRHAITNRTDDFLISMQLYPEHFRFDEAYNPSLLFEKWACAEVITFDQVPEGMHSYTLKDGLYAVFPYKGSPSDATPFFRSIFNVWLPEAGYSIDQRAHFEVLGSKYKNNDPESEEEIYIPVKPL